MRGFDKKKLRETFVYDEVNGGLYYKSGKKKGQRFGSPQKNQPEFRTGRYGNHVVREHVLIWCYHYGEYPDDHVVSSYSGKDKSFVENLRLLRNSNWRQIVTKRERQSSPFRGVFWHKRHQKYYAKIMKDNKAYHLGTFVDAYRAALVYDEAARSLFGKDAYTNFGEDQ